MARLHGIELTAAEVFRADLRKRGLKASQVAQDLGVGRVYLSQIINGHARSNRMRQKIARRFGRHYLTLLRPWSDHARRSVDGQSGAAVQCRLVVNRVTGVTR